MQIKGSYKIDVIDDVSGEKIHSYTQENKVFVDRFNDNLKLMKLLANSYIYKKINDVNGDDSRNTNNITTIQNLQFIHAMVHNMVNGEYALFFTNDSMILHDTPDFMIDDTFRLYDLWQQTTVIDSGDVIGISHIDKETPLFTKHDETKGKSIKFNINTPLNKKSISCRNISIPDLRQKRISYDVEYSYAYNSDVSETKETEKIYSIGLVPSMNYKNSQQPQSIDSNGEISGYFDNSGFFLDKVFGVDYGVTKLQQIYNPNNVTNESQENFPTRDNYYNSLVIDNLITYSELDIPQTVNYRNEDGTKSTKTFVITYKLQYLFNVPENTDTYKETYLNSLYNQAITNEKKKIQLNQSEQETQNIFLPLMLSYYTYLYCYEYTKQTKDDVLKIINERNTFIRKERLLQVLDDFMSANLVNDEFKNVDGIGVTLPFLINSTLGINQQFLENKNPFLFINTNHNYAFDDNKFIIPSRSLLGDTEKSSTSDLYFNNVCQNRYSFIPLYKFKDVAEVNDFISKVTFNTFEHNQNTVEYPLLMANKLAFYATCNYKGKKIPFICYNHVHLNNIYLLPESWQFVISKLQPEVQEFNAIINGYTNNYFTGLHANDFYNFMFGTGNLRYEIKYYDKPIKIKNDDGDYLDMIKNACDLYDNSLSFGL